MDSNRRSAWRWVVYAASCLVGFLDFALALTFGSMFVHLLDRYGENRATTATVHSILLGTATIASVVSGILIRQIGVGRVSFLGSVLLSGGFVVSFFAKSILVLDVFIGVIGGIGISFIYISSTVVARNCFDGPARDIALSAYNFCVGIGSIAYSYVYSLLISSYTVNETFLVLGGLFLNNFVFALLFLLNENDERLALKNHLRTLDQKVNSIEVQANDSNRDPTKWLQLRQALERLVKCFVSLMHFRFVLVLVGAGLATASINAYLVVFNDIYAWKQFTEKDSLLLFIMHHAFSSASRLFPIVISKLRPGYDLMILLTMCALFGTVGQLCILLSSQVSLSIVGSILTGMAHGGTINTATVAMAKLSTKDSFSVAFGLLFTLIGVLTILNGVIYGYIRDTVESYELNLILTAVMNGVGACLFLMTPVYERCRRATMRQVAVSEQPRSSPPSDGIIGLAFHNKTFCK